MVGKSRALGDIGAETAGRDRFGNLFLERICREPPEKRFPFESASREIARQTARGLKRHTHEEDGMAQGRVKWFNDKKGYGFIETDSQGDVFVHYSSIEGDGFRTLREAEEVTFEIEDSPKGPQAVNVRRA
jgi:CspA family cold shock protein